MCSEYHESLDCRNLKQEPPTCLNGHLSTIGHLCVMESHKCNILIFILDLKAFFKNGNERPLSYLNSIILILILKRNLTKDNNLLKNCLLLKQHLHDFNNRLKMANIIHFFLASPDPKGTDRTFPRAFKWKRLPYSLT